MSGLTDRLRQVAGQATPGPWDEDGPWWHDDDDPAHMVSARSGRRAVAINPPTHSAAAVQTNITYIATFDPVLVEAMLDVIDAAEHAAGFAARGQGSTPVLTQQIVAELDAALVRLREVSG